MASKQHQDRTFVNKGNKPVPEHLPLSDFLRRRSRRSAALEKNSETHPWKIPTNYRELLPMIIMRRRIIKWQSAIPTCWFIDKIVSSTSPYKWYYDTAWRWELKEKATVLHRKHHASPPKFHAGLTQFLVSSATTVSWPLVLRLQCLWTLPVTSAYPARPHEPRREKGKRSFSDIHFN